MTLTAKILAYAAVMLAGIALLVAWYIRDKTRMPVCKECQTCKFNNMGDCESTILCESGEMWEENE